MSPEELAALAQLSEAKKQQELAKLQPFLAARKAVALQVAELRSRIAEPLATPDDPGALLRDSEHRAVLELRLRERLQAQSRLEARIAQASPALARATARQDVAETLEKAALKDRKKRAEKARLVKAVQVTS